jgi:hypothetical protein
MPKTLVLGERPKPSAFELVDAAGAERPDVSRPVLIHVRDLTGLHPLGRAEQRQLPMIVQDHPTPGPHPDSSPAIAEEGVEPPDLLG